MMSTEPPLHAYLADAITAHNRGDPVPLLT
jgi:hypothetical protein